MRSLPATKSERDRGKPADPLRNSIQRAQKNSLATKFFPFYSSPYPMTHHRHPHAIPICDRPS
ncbi:hypothetical protein A8F26_15085 [Burkholderia cenocepacia]|nr:hypothetical protein A8D61_31395 [Burkholderia cenocepacia]EPZ89663.1 hypothetical protein BURCENK562V_C2560 [Burkholderia cenocepacia K56-2Valvano]ONJ17000.1 hypothetical protein A8D82_26755 [Burkholderia cenocepacia]ONN79830.1 hypothetical protein A8D62_34180 [Burkholderia cenocepacia]ONN80624.1 hypothetical protein A8D64_28455 [Burkholderia cenocepacia]